MPVSKKKPATKKKASKKSTSKKLTKKGLGGSMSARQKARAMKGAPKQTNRKYKTKK